MYRHEQEKGKKKKMKNRVKREKNKEIVMVCLDRMRMAGDKVAEEGELDIIEQASIGRTGRRTKSRSGGHDGRNGLKPSRVAGWNVQKYKGIAVVCVCFSLCSLG